jgi:hypothetical protein
MCAAPAGGHALQSEKMASRSPMRAAAIMDNTTREEMIQ